MRKFNWKEKTGITEAQAAQVIAGVLCGIAAWSGYEVIAAYSAAGSQVLIGLITHQLRRKQKKKAAPMTDKEFLTGLADSDAESLAKAAEFIVGYDNGKGGGSRDHT